MKTILLATDFSESSKDAARYGYALACQIKANVLLANAMTKAGRFTDVVKTISEGPLLVLPAL